MNIIYNDVDITESVHVIANNNFDRMGGEADNISVSFSDIEDNWGKWNPQKNDRIKITQDGYSTGIMYIDSFEQTQNIFTINAISIPINSKEPKTRAWYSVRFLSVAQDVANSLGLILEQYNVTNYLYSKVLQSNETDLAFLNRLCVREGYCLKITNSKLVIYDERLLEATAPVLALTKDDIIGKHGFSDNQSLSEFNVSFFDTSFISNTYKDTSIIGGKGKINEPVFSIAEVERFAKNYLRNVNKFAVTGALGIEVNPNVSAGSTLTLSGFGRFDGKYIIYQVNHDFTKDISHLKIRHVLENY